MVVAKLLNGEIDAGVLPINVAAKLYNAGVPIQALAVVGNGMVKFLTTDPAIDDLSDISGKTIYIAGQKATPDYLFQYLCAQKGLIAGKDYVPIYNLAIRRLLRALRAGKLHTLYCRSLSPPRRFRRTARLELRSTSPKSGRQ